MNRFDFIVYFEFGKELEEWKEGIEIVRRLARLVGMVLEGDGNVYGDEDGSDGRDGGGIDNWFWRLFDFSGNIFIEVFDDNFSLFIFSDEEEISFFRLDILGR